MVEELLKVGSKFGDYAGASIGLGLVVVGVGIGIGLIGAKAVESLVRQPEMKKDIITMMMLGVALVEGMAFFAAIICLLVIFTK